MKNKVNKKNILIVILLIVLIIVLYIVYMTINVLGIFHEGNSKIYDVQNISVIENSPIQGKNIIFLGSSVTGGLQARGISFVDYIGKRHNINFIKEAVSGTTLVDNGEKSYVQRMLTIDKNYDADMFVCQLSTNDASKKLPIGEISQSKKLDDFDTSTITGSIEYIIGYASATWDTPVVFYTNTYYNDENYEEMVKRLYELQEKWDIDIIDMWNDKELNSINDETRKLYMRDIIIHPTKAGYLEWYTPKIETDIIKYMK